jgi:thiamine-monophosphate kinase
MGSAATRFCDLGESALIARIARRAGSVSSRDWGLRIGDDAALLRPKAGDEIALSTDAQIEGTHFRFGRESARTIGRRALAVNLSDLAAMGARPVGALLSLAAPASAKVADLDAVIDGFVAEGARHGCPLVGGNLARADQWVLDVTVVGRCRRGRALRRRGARPGDGLYVTGTLGGAALARLSADARGGRLTRVPTPRLEAGQALARLPGVRACLDVSDGLATDLAHLLEAEGVGAELEPDRLPAPAGLRRGCRALGLDPLAVQTQEGEDYELLFAYRSARSTDASPMLSRRLGLRVTRIGRVISTPGLQGLPGVAIGHHF